MKEKPTILWSSALVPWHMSIDAFGTAILHKCAKFPCYTSLWHVGTQDVPAKNEPKLLSQCLCGDGAGTIPPELGHLVSLEILDLSGTPFRKGGLSGKPNALLVLLVASLHPRD